MAITRLDRSDRYYIPVRPVSPEVPEKLPSRLSGCISGESGCSPEYPEKYPENPGY